MALLRTTVRCCASVYAMAMPMTLLLLPWLAAVAEVDEPFHPGHYVALAPYADGPDVMADVMRPGVVGVQKRYPWRELEPRPGEYDFSGIAGDLLRMAEVDGQLVVFISDKSFNNERPTPRYLWQDHTLPIESQATGTGYVAERWDPYVVQRFSRLLEHMGRAFDDHPNLEGVAIQETALGVADDVLDGNGYTPERYRDALIEQLDAAAAAFPNSRIFWYANYLPRNQSYIASVAAAVRSRQVVVGGPDVLPDDRPLQRHVYPLLRNLDRRTPRFNSVQFNSYRHEHRMADAASRYWTPCELLRYARDDLQVSYLFWTRVRHPQPADSYSIEDAYPVIMRHPLTGASVAR